MAATTTRTMRTSCPTGTASSAGIQRRWVSPAATLPKKSRTARSAEPEERAGHDGRDGGGEGASDPGQRARGRAEDHLAEVEPGAAGGGKEREGEDDPRVGDDDLEDDAPDPHADGERTRDPRRAHQLDPAQAQRRGAPLALLEGRLDDPGRGRRSSGGAGRPRGPRGRGGRRGRPAPRCGPSVARPAAPGRRRRPRRGRAPDARSAGGGDVLGPELEDQHLSDADRRGVALHLDHRGAGGAGLEGVGQGPARGAGPVLGRDAAARRAQGENPGVAQGHLRDRRGGPGGAADRRALAAAR